MCVKMCTFHKQIDCTRRIIKQTYNKWHISSELLFLDNFRASHKYSQTMNNQYYTCAIHMDAKPLASQTQLSNVKLY